MSPTERKQKDFIFESKEKFRPVNREEIYGAEHLLKQADKLVDLLKNFRIYREAGVSFGGGALFIGSPGTGKTLLARYVATMSGARFINMRKAPIALASGSGVHVWRPQDLTNLFKFGEEYAAKNNRLVVLFVDQFDNWLKVNKDIIDQLEIELDGFSGRKEGVYLVVTAKEKPENSTLFRGKRIDQIITFTLPDRKQRIALLNGFIDRYPHKESIGVSNLSCMLVDSSPANIESAVDEAYQFCVRRAKLAEAEAKISVISKRSEKMPELRSPQTNRTATIELDNEALIEVFLSRATEAETGRVLSTAEERKIAIHELGHYVISRALGLPTQFFTVRPTEENLGENFISSGGIVKSMEVEEVRRFIATFLGSIKIEQLFGFSPREGSVGDLENATNSAKEMVYQTCHQRSKPLREYGLMSVELGDEDYSPVISDSLRMKLEKEVGLVLREEEKRCQKILKLFGKKILIKVLETFLSKQNKMMLQAEIDPLLEPKLSEFHKKHGIRDLILEENW